MTAGGPRDATAETRRRRTYWGKSRKRYIASASLGYGPDGKRIVKKASERTKTGAKESSRRSSVTTKMALRSRRTTIRWLTL